MMELEHFNFWDTQVKIRYTDGTITPNVGFWVPISMVIDSRYTHLPCGDAQAVKGVASKAIVEARAGSSPSRRIDSTPQKFLGFGA
jgi:hypothetical protein